MLSDDDLHAILRKCGSHLTELHLLQCTKITHASLSKISSFCPHLTHFTLQDCGPSVEPALLSIVSSCSHLLHLDLDGYATDDLLKNVASSQLRTLKTSASSISDHALEKITEKCRDLEIVDLSNSKITDVALGWLADRELNLKSLTLTNCKEVQGIFLSFSMEILTSARSLRRDLRKLRIQSWSNWSLPGRR